MRQSFLTFTAAFLASASSAAVLPVRSSSLQWTQCDNAPDPLHPGVAIPVLCSTLQVPLDYTDKDSKITYPLKLRKIEARKGVAKRETVIANYGGPGNSGVQFFNDFGPQQSYYIGPDRDLVTWEPRGSEGDLLFKCYANSSAPTPTILGNASDAALHQLWDEASVFSDTCAQAQKANGGLVGGAFTARDMMQIVDALGEDGMLRYYGLSYGTVLGVTVASMFPDRIERLLLDGNIDSQSYYHGYGLRAFDSADDVFLGFCDSCLKNPDHCPLASTKSSSSALELRESLFDFVEDLKASPLSLPAVTPNGSVNVPVTYTTLKFFIYQSLYYPGEWHNTSIALAEILQHNATSFYATNQANQASFGAYNTAESLQGIKCSDTYSRANTLDELKPYIEQVHKTSRIGGDMDDGFFITPCARWGFAAKERPLSDFRNIKTKYGALLLNNKFDAVTSLQAAKNVSEGLLGSSLMVQNGYGHTTTSQVSLCTAKTIRQYWTNGTLPQSGTMCETDDRLFNATSYSEAFVNVLRNLDQGTY